jgi:hypothetical protein
MPVAPLIEPSQLDVSSLSVVASVWREGSDNDSSYLAPLRDLPTESIKREKSPSADWRPFGASTARPLRHPIKALLALRALESLRYREFRLIGMARCLP